MFDCDIVYCLWPCVSYLSVLYCVVYDIHNYFIIHIYYYKLMFARLFFLGGGGGGRYFSELEYILF